MVAKRLKGGAKTARIVGAISASSPGAAGTLTVDDASGWPDGSDGKYFVGALDEGEVTQEHVLFVSRSGTGLVVSQRGYDDTTAVAHSNNATLKLIADGVLLQALDDHLQAATTGVHTAAQVTNVAAGTIVATTVQAAIDELDTEKAPKASPTFTGTVTLPTTAMADAELGRPLLKDYAETVVDHGSMGATETIDLEAGNVHIGVLDANCTFTFSNPPASGRCGSFTLRLTQDGTGSRTATWPASVDWAGGVAPTLSTTAGARDRLGFVTEDGGTTWDGVLLGRGFA